MTVRDALSEAARLIASRDAEVLAAHVLERDRSWLLAHPDAPLECTPLSRFYALVARRAAHEPLQYITGQQEFYGIALRVTPDVLIPRPETEHLVEAVLLWATRFHDERTLRIADIGTGSGAISIALATHLAGAEFVATDVSAAALQVARENAETHGIAHRIRFMECDLLPPDAAPLDAIVSNPPYVALTDATTLAEEVLAHEPHGALFAGEDGLALYRRLIPAARDALRAEGLLALEFGFGQRDAIAAMLEDWQHVRFIDDYQGNPRVALAQRPKE